MSAGLEEKHFMFFKFKGVYRQFSYFSLRLLNKKFLTTSNITTPSFSSSPSKNRKGFLLKNGWKANNPELRSILQKELRAAYSQLQMEKAERTKDLIQIYQDKFINQTQSSSTKSVSKNNNKPEATDIINSQKSLEFMFPLLTGEELKAFDSSVFE